MKQHVSMMNSGMRQLLITLRIAAVDFLAPTRVWDWWEFKVPAFLGVTYLTAIAADIPFEALWPRLIVIVAALVPLASYVCVINEITDRHADRVAGKPNCMIGRSRIYQASWLVACAAGGVFGCAALRHSDTTTWLYVLNWLAFTLYSVPPVRLKGRGIWGGLADACGGQVMPTLWTVAFISYGAETPLPRGIKQHLFCKSWFSEVGHLASMFR